MTRITFTIPAYATPKSGNATVDVEGGYPVVDYRRGAGGSGEPSARASGRPAVRFVSAGAA
ncbi:hypothetical protein [Haloarchaeobius sp. HRN-SO-5]|uniref:hypothetical protein n=1 Tax=Haloarchaeobius sp. HRN-SO-5 TaxID=3446118 RepID=UPI003EB8E42F